MQSLSQAEAGTRVEDTRWGDAACERITESAGCRAATGGHTGRATWLVIRSGAVFTDTRLKNGTIAAIESTSGAVAGCSASGVLGSSLGGLAESWTRQTRGEVSRAVDAGILPFTCLIYGIGGDTKAAATQTTAIIIVEGRLARVSPENFSEIVV